MSDDKRNINNEQILTQKIVMPSLKELENKIFNLFHKKYSISNTYHGKLIINNIIYNEKTHIVAKFKDFLVIDDLSEFLKRFYKNKESLTRLPLYFDYYHIYSKIFPNYTSLKESKYIYKNIHKKQKMIDLQQEEESEEKRKEKEKKYIKHQRKKNKNEINTIFNNDVYNSIIKQSQDLYMLLFGIDKNDNNNSNSFTSFDIKDIVKLIEKYDYESKIRFNYKNNLIIPKIYKKINTKKLAKKDNNSSLTTKQSTFNSSAVQQKRKNFGKFYKNNDDIIIGLKKSKNEKKSITSNSLLISHKISKNNFVPNHLKTLTNNDKTRSKSKSTKKEIKKVKKIKVNQKLLFDDNTNYLTERTSHSRYKNLKFNFTNNLRNKNSNKISNSNSKIKTKLINKKSLDFNYYSQINSNNNNNSNIYKHKRINTNTYITESSKYKEYKIKLLNRTKAKNIIENNNKLKLNLKEMREQIKNNRISDKNFYTERESMTYKQKDKNKDKDKILQNINKDSNNIIKRISNHKKSFPSIELKTKINKNFLLSQRMINNSKINKYNFKTNFLPLPFKENFKINKNQIMEICNRKLSSNLNKIEDKNFYTERASVQIPKKENLQDKVKIIISNDFPILKNLELKYYKTTTNSKNKDKINNKEKNNINKNTFQMRKSNKGYKYIKRKEVSPMEYSKYTMLNNTERDKQILNVKLLLNKNKK